MFEVMQFVTMHPVFKSLSVIVCDNSVVSSIGNTLLSLHLVTFLVLFHITANRIFLQSSLQKLISVVR